MIFVYFSAISPKKKSSSEEVKDFVVYVSSIAKIKGHIRKYDCDFNH